MSRPDLNRRLGFPKVKLRWLRMLLYRRFLDWYRRSRFCRTIGSGMQTPIEATFRHLELRGLCPAPVIALEVFGGTGLFKTIDLAKRCQHITFFELSESLIHHAKKLLPRDRTVFLNQDSIQAVRSGQLPRRDYNLIHIDNSIGRFGVYCENFDLFPAVVDCLGDHGTLVFNVWLDVRDQKPDAEWLARRKAFFGLGDGDDAACVSLETAKQAYLARIPRDRFSVRDVFPVPHLGETIYLVVSLERVQARREPSCEQPARAGGEPPAAPLATDDPATSSIHG